MPTKNEHDVLDALNRRMLMIMAVNNEIAELERVLRDARRRKKRFEDDFDRLKREAKMIVTPDVCPSCKGEKWLNIIGGYTLLCSRCRGRGEICRDCRNPDGDCECAAMEADHAAR